MIFNEKKYNNKSPENVEEYYKEWTEKYQEDLGDFFQAMQAEDLSELVEYYIQSMGITDGMKILDAGCGVGGPALEISKIKNINLSAVNISKKQIEIAKSRAKDFNINFIHGDFHQLENIFSPETFDGIYFMESMVHSHDPEKVIQSVRKVLKKNGFIYIKDLFKGPNHPENPEVMGFPVRAVNEQFCLDIRNVGDILNALIQNGFELQFCKQPSFNSSFDKGNLFTAKHLFQLLQNQSGPWMDKGLIFLHWLEIKAIKIY